MDSPFWLAEGFPGGRVTGRFARRGSRQADLDQGAPGLAVVGIDRRPEDPGRRQHSTRDPDSGLRQPLLEPALDHLRAVSRGRQQHQDDPPVGRLDPHQVAVPGQGLAQAVAEGEEGGAAPLRVGER
jgi:hypothetical protein